MRHIFTPSKDIRRTILVADDEPVNRMILTHNLGRFYDTIEAVDGRDTMEKIRANRDHLSLVMLDLNMPEMTGYQVLQEMQADEALHRIPVIVLTSEKGAEIESLQLGAVDFLEKGRDMPEVVKARVQRSIELAEDAMIIRSTENDELTGLYNRKYFFEYARMLQQAQPDWEMDAIALNVERFQAVNEFYGRQFGDRVLQTIAEAIRRTVPPGEGLASRNEADAFFIYIRHGERTGEIISEAVESALKRMDAAATISIRLGVYPMADPEESLESQFDRATVACNSIRNDFTTRIARYNDAFAARLQLEERLVGDFQRAIEEDQIQVFFQPKYRIQGETPQLSSAEALVRWHHPELGWLSPGQFIPVFERNGLISRLDHAVWRKAAARMRSWIDRFGIAFPVSINISRVDMFDGNLYSKLVGLVEEFDLDPARYLLEITESAYVDDEQQLIRHLQQLKEAGFVIEMDDFGTGYSSLNSLADLPLDVLKIDMSFVRRLTADEDTHRMVSIIMEIAQWRQVETVAEGVETAEQLQILKKLGCDIVQGYYFSKPLPADEFEEKLQREYEPNV